MRVGPAWLFVIASAIWGSTWFAITYQVGDIAPEVSVAYRFALAAASLALWCLASGRSLRFSLREHGWLAGLGAMLFGFNYIGVYWAESYVASGLVAVMFSTLVFINPVGMRLFFGARLSVRTFVAAALGVTGVALLFLPEFGQTRGNAAYGIAFGIGATIIASGGNLIAQRNQRAAIPTLAGNAWGMGYGAAIAALTAAVQGERWTFDAAPPYVLSLAYLALFGSVIAFGAYLTLIKRIGATRAAYTAVATPVIALLLSTLFEGYRWTWAGGLGVLLAIAGIVLALGGPRPRFLYRPEKVSHSVSSRRD